MNQTGRKPKPPACDACKARRVLCHRQPDGLPCPRCVEKGVECKTTYVPRGRPRKNFPPDIGPSLSVSQEPSKALESTLSVTTSVPQSGAIVVRSSFETAFGELPSELVQHLFECFAQSPHSHFPLFSSTNLPAALSSASWKIDLLPPDARVLAYCICAQASLISFHPAIIGPGPKPDSLADGSVLFPGADLRMYGMRRSAACRALYERSVALAREAGIYLQASEYNAASCFILSNMDESPSRPWALAYISHVRSLAENWNWSLRGDVDSTKWAAYLMVESILAILKHKPIIPTYADQLLLTGSEPPPLGNLLEYLRPMVQASKKTIVQMVYTTVRPILFHVIRLCRELHEKIAGDHARRCPIAESAVTDFLSALSTLQSIVSLLFTQSQWLFKDRPLFFGRRNSDEENVRSCISIMTVGLTSLAIALHCETDYRYRAATITSTQSDSASCNQDQNQVQWAVARMALLRGQAHAMASAAVEDVARYLKLRPFPPDSLAWTVVMPWAHFCLDEADAAGGIVAGRFEAFVCILDTLKALGYSRDNQELYSLVERMESHVAAAPMRNSAWTAGTSDHNSLQPSAQILDLNMSFPLDDCWLGTMFGLHSDVNSA